MWVLVQAAANPCGFSLQQKISRRFKKIGCSTSKTTQKFIHMHSFKNTSGYQLVHSDLVVSKPCVFKGTVSRDFSLLVFFINQFPPSPRVSHQDRFEIFRKFAEIFPAQGWPPVSTTNEKWEKSSIRKILIILFGHLWIVVDTGGKFATGINNTSETGGKICRRCRWHRCCWYRWSTLSCEYLREF
jgi:hypothetical protein